MLLASSYARRRPARSFKKGNTRMDVSTSKFTGFTPSTRQASPKQGARAIVPGRTVRNRRRLLETTLTPPPNKTRRPTAAPEQYHLLTSPDFVDPPAATAAAAASPQREAAAAPVPG